MSRTPTINITANKPYFTAPKILGTRVVDDVEYYICEGGRKFVKETYDKLFKVERGEIKPKNHRTSSDPRSIDLPIVKENSRKGKYKK